MKKILIVLTLLCLSGCITSGTQYIGGTMIGVSAGYDGVSLTVGYRRFEALQCENGTKVDIGLDGKATIAGLEGEQHIKLGGVK